MFKFDQFLAVNNNLATQEVKDTPKTKLTRQELGGALAAIDKKTLRMIDKLCPEGVDQEEFRQAKYRELFDEVKQVQLAQGQLMTDELTMAQDIYNRLEQKAIKQARFDRKYTKDEKIIQARQAYAESGNVQGTFKQYLSYLNRREDELSESEIQDYLRLTESEQNRYMLDNYYWGITLPESAVMQVGTKKAESIEEREKISQAENFTIHKLFGDTGFNSGYHKSSQLYSAACFDRLASFIDLETILRHQDGFEKIDDVSRESLDYVYLMSANNKLKNIWSGLNVNQAQALATKLLKMGSRVLIAEAESKKDDETIFKQADLEVYREVESVSQLFGYSQDAGRPHQEKIAMFEIMRKNIPQNFSAQQNKIRSIIKQGYGATFLNDVCAEAREYIVEQEGDLFIEQAKLQQTELGLIEQTKYIESPKLAQLSADYAQQLLKEGKIGVLTACLKEHVFNLHSLGPNIFAAVAELTQGTLAAKQIDYAAFYGLDRQAFKSFLSSGHDSKKGSGFILESFQDDIPELQLLKQALEDGSPEAENNATLEHIIKLDQSTFPGLAKQCYNLAHYENLNQTMFNYLINQDESLLLNRKISWNKFKNLNEASFKLFHETDFSFDNLDFFDQSIPLVAELKALSEGAHRGDYFLLSQYLRRDFLQIESYQELSPEAQMLARKLRPWSDSLSKMTALQARANRAEYDPWVTDLKPLIVNVTDNKIISKKKAEDGKLLYDYVDRFGMKNKPKLFALFADLHRHKDLQGLSEKTETDLWQYFGIDCEALAHDKQANATTVFNKIDQHFQKINIGLRNEEKHIAGRVIKSPYDLELVEGIVGNSGHSHAVSAEAAIKIYLEAEAKDPSKFKVPAGYQATTIQVPEFVVKGDSVDLLKNERDKVLKNKELGQVLADYDDLLNQANRVSYDEMLIGKAEELSDYFSENIDDLKRRLQDERERDPVNEKLITGLEKQLLTAKKQQQIWQDSWNSALAKSPKNKALELFAQKAPDNWNGYKNTLMQLSLYDMQEKLPDGYQNLLSAKKSPNADATILAYHDFLRYHVKEHYLDKKHGEQAALASDDKKLMKTLQKSWGTFDWDNSIVAVTANKLQLLERGEISAKSKNIDLLPSKGLLRVFSGDLGHACTSRQNDKLAVGEFPEIVSYSLLLNKDTADERFAGSFLVIETKAENGEPVLVLRANNPAQFLFNMVDGDSLVEAIMAEVRALAERRGIKKVVAPAASGGTSNRTEVSNYYKEHFKDRAPVPLQDNEATNFNHYSIWNPSSVDYCVTI
jgi:hypothetical protein